MKLGMQVRLGTGHIMLDGDPAPPKRGKAVPPLFGPCLLWPRSPISATAKLLLQVMDEIMKDDRMLIKGLRAGST